MSSSIDPGEGVTRMVPLESALSTSFPITSAMPAPNFMSFTHPDSASSQISLDDMLTGLLPEVLPLADLNISSNSHSSPEMRKCPVCNRNYRNSTRLAVHILEIHAREEERPFSCPSCSARFHRSGTLAAHIRTHSGERPFTCQECYQDFTQRSALRRHQLVHCQSVSNACRHCARVFRHKSSRDRHEQLKHPPSGRHSAANCSPLREAVATE